MEQKNRPAKPVAASDSAERLSAPFAHGELPGERLSEQETHVYRGGVRDTFNETSAMAARTLRDDSLASAPARQRRLAGMLAEYVDPASCMTAAAAVRDQGYARWDVHTPYPVHGMDEAMGLKSTKIGWIAMACGLTGCLSAVLMIQWMNGYDYPLIVGGKPPGSIPSMIPIMFELSILLSGFGTVFGLLGLCKLPQHHHALFESERFARFSDDRFFISIESADPRFDVQQTRQLLEQSQAVHVELVEEES